MSVMIELPDELAERLRREAEKRRKELSEYVLPALEGLADTQPSELETHARTHASTVEDDQNATGHHPNYLEALLEIANSFTPEDLAHMPPDGAREIDHYVYGLPKRGSETP